MRRASLLAVLLALVWIGAGFAQSKSGITGTVKNRWVEKFPIVVYVEDVPGETFAPPAKPAQVDQRDKVFLPRVLPVVAGTKVDFLNNDPFEHNVYTPDHEKYNLGNWPKGETRSHTFKTPGVYAQLCKMHPEMIAYVVVLKNPYFAVTDQAGKFAIAGVPPGSYKLRVWGERLRPKQIDKTFEVKVAAGQTSEISLEP